MCRVLKLVLCLASALPLLAQAPALHPFTVHDWAAARSASAISVSPDGGTILYRVSFGGDSGPTNREFWFIHSDGSSPGKLDLPAGFIPVGFLPSPYASAGLVLYGTYRVNNQPQLAVFAMTGSKAAAAPMTLVALPRGVEAIVPSPDGSHFALLADPRAPDPLEATRTVVEPDQASLYLVRIDGTGGEWACPTLHNLAGGPGSPTSPIAWSPDSSEIVLLSTTPKLGNYDLHSYLDLCSPATGPHRLAEIPNAVFSIAFTNPTEIAFVSTTAPTQTPDHLYTIATTGGAFVDRTPNLAMTANSLVVDPKGTLFVAVDHGVRSEVYTFTGGSLTLAYTWPDGVVDLPVFSPYAAATPQLVFSVTDPTHANNVAVASGGGLRRITSEGEGQLAKVAFGPVRVVHWTTNDGIALEGIATFPADYLEGKKYPFLVLPHGGPEAHDNLALDPFSRIIAGLGYVVLQPEYRGSTGFGEAHLAAIYQHFGDLAYADVDSATDFAIAQGWADPARLAIFGWSAGGFMTSWTVTQTHRYKAAIEGAGITDWSSFMFTSDVNQTDFDARWPEENPTAFSRFSAVNFAKNVTTPLLILHGESDVRVPTFQGREFYEVLAARGKTTRLVTYPGSPHFPTLWQQRINVFDEIAAWLAKYNP
jgi:dipeptidyl aminopeptidase/acylaminoacyl peptidase